MITKKREGGSLPRKGTPNYAPGESGGAQARRIWTVDLFSSRGRRPLEESAAWLGGSNS